MSGMQTDPDRPWGFLPPFANDENRQLHASILELESSLKQLDAEVGENSNGIAVLAEHLESVKQDTQYANAKLMAKKKETETEDHLVKLAEREAARLDAERKKAKGEQDKLEQKIHQLRMSVFKCNEELDAFKLEMNFNAGELQKWIAEREKQEEDRAVLEKYKRQDEALVKELNMQIDKLNKHSIQVKEELHHEITEAQAAQIELDKAADDFRQAHRERLKLMEQWDETVESLKRRDRIIEDTTAKLNETQFAVLEKEERMTTLSKKLENEIQEEKKLETKMESTTRELGLLREKLREEEKRAVETQSLLDLLQLSHSKAQKDLAQKTLENKTSRDHLQALKHSVEAALEKYQTTKTQVEQEKSRLEAKEIQDDAMQSKLQIEEKTWKVAQQEVRDLEQEQYREGQILFAEKQKETGLISEISGVTSQDKNMRSKITAIDEEILKQEEILYGINFRIVMMQRKVERAAGVRSESETKELNAVIEKLSQELQHANAEHALLVTQSKKSEHQLNQAERRRHNQMQQQGMVEKSIDEMQLETDMIQRSIIQKREEKENLMVEQDVMQLEIGRLRQVLSHKWSEVRSLEMKKAMMKSSIKEKQTELHSHQDCLKYELKNIRDDLHRVKLDLSDKKQHLEKLQLKYDTMASKKDSVYDDEPKSQGYFLIRAAQEKEELRKEGDELNADIKKAEHEVAGLENALRGIICCNQDYKSSLSHLPGSELWTMHAGLKKEMDHVYDHLKFKRTEETTLLAKIKRAETRLAELQAGLTHLRAAIDEHTHQLREADRQAKDQIERETRARSRAKRLNEDVACKEAAKASQVRLCAVQDVNRSIVVDLRTAGMHQGCELSTQAIQELESAGISMPNSAATSRRTTPRSTRPNSTQTYRSRPGTGSSAASVSIKNMQLSI